jgi:outer membrane autotransporter protein
MNTTHRSIWNAALGAWVAVSEVTRSCGKRSGAAVALVLIGASVCSSAWAQQVRIIEGGDVLTVPGDESSPWDFSSGSLRVGGSGAGTLIVNSAGVVDVANLNVGSTLGSTGTVIVTGPGSSVLVRISKSIGRRGTGTITLADGGLLSAVSGGLTFLYIADEAGSTGALNIGAAAGSAAQAAGTVSVTRVIFGDGSGSLNFNHTNSAYTFGTEITGTGVLNHYAGTTILTGANTYSGATTVSGGILRAGAANTLSSSSAFTLANTAGATLDLNNFNQTIGSLSGGGATGGDITLGSGTLTTGGNNSSTSFGGVISGSGAFHKAGTGNLILTGTNTYSGATSVNGGTLRVNGSIANSAVTVNSGGTLGGSGTVGSTLITSGGLLAPGNSIGTLTVNGDLNFAAGSIYRVEVDAAGNNDRTNVTGTAALNGTVDVQASAGTYAANTTYTILNAAGGRSGNFAEVTSNLAFLTPTLAYDANNVFLSLARNDISFSAVAQTPNQIAASTALQNANAGATGDMNTVINAVTGLSAEQARAAYDSVAGSGLVALRNAGASFAAGLGTQLQARLGTVQGSASNALASALSSRPILLAANSHTSDLTGLLNTMSDSPPQKFSLAGGASLPSAASSQGRGFWLRGSGGYRDTKSDDNAGASELRNTALSAGFDTQLQEGLVMGAALSSGTSRLGFDNTDTGKSRGGAVAMYGSYVNGPWTFKGSASAAWSSNHMDRAVTLGALSRRASADFDSNTLSAYGEATYNVPMNGWTLQPLAGLAFSRNKTDGFTETGAGALNLQVAGQTTTSTKSLLGAKASFEAGHVRLEPRAIWAHEFGDLNKPMTAQFQGAATASPFQVSGVALRRDSLVLGLGVSGQLRKGLTLVADGQVEANSRQRNLAVFVGLRGVW